MAFEFSNERGEAMNIGSLHLIDNSDVIKNALPEQIEIALEAVGLQAEGYAKLKCPVDTGRLKNSITHATTKNEKAVYVGTNVEYAPYVEMGHIDAKSGKHVAAQPYLAPAVTEHVPEYKAIAEHFLKQ